MSTDLSSFQALIEKARQQIAANKPSNRRRAAVEESAEIAEYQYHNYYDPEAYFFRVWRQTCQCGALHIGLEGVYEEKKHQKTSSRITRRLTEVKDLDPKLPKYTVVIDETVAYCFTCISIPVPEKVSHATPSQP